MLILSSCKKEMNYKAIRFDYADHYAGVYNCIETKFQSGPSIPQIDTQQVQIVNVIDLRNDKLCLFYIDYLKDTVIVLSNGYFYRSNAVPKSTDIGTSFESELIGYFHNDSIYYHNYSKTEYTHYSSATFIYIDDLKGIKR